MTSGVQGGRAILHLPSSQDSNPARINMTVSSEQTAQLDGRIQTSVQQNQLLIGGGISGGPGEFRYMDQAGIDRIRQENSHIRTGGFARWTHSDIRHFKGIIGLSIIEREEPGPEGFTLPGRRSKQQLTDLGQAQPTRISSKRSPCRQTRLHHRSSRCHFLTAHIPR